MTNPPIRAVSKLEKNRIGKKRSKAVIRANRDSVTSPTLLGAKPEANRAYFQVLPFQCRMRVRVPVPPTAHP
jgi:hypothetical protein